MISEKDLERFAKLAEDWRWRFTNLYWIKPADDRPKCLFEPRKEQWKILEDIYENGNTRLAILKARQLGFSTLLSLICLDWMLCRPGVRIAILDQKEKDAQKKLGKIKFAWGNLPADMKRWYRIDDENKSEFSFRLRVKGDAQRYIEAGESARGDTYQLMWISEWGPIQKEDARRSDRIADGALPAAEKGLVVVETTWRGGKSGRLYDDVVEPGLKIPEKFRTTADWKIHFFAWWLDKTLVFEGDVSQIDPLCYAYLKEVEAKEGIRFTKGQALWYFKVAWVKREKRYEEYPSRLPELFLSPEPGAIYAEEMAELRASRRITSFPVEKGLPVWASFDIGRDDAMPVTLFQLVGERVRIVDYHTSNKENVRYYADWLHSWMRRNRIQNLRVVLPHDGKRQSVETGKTLAEKFEEFGFPDAVTVNRIPRIWDGIDMVRDLFPYLQINSDQCDQEIKIAERKRFPSLIECLERYHSIDYREGKNITTEPVHDRYSHGADSVRTFAEAYAAGLIRNGSGRRPRVQNITGGGRMIDRDFDRQTRKAQNVTPW